jgi:hypothetical protein
MGFPHLSSALFIVPSLESLEPLGRGGWKGRRKERRVRERTYFGSNPT